MFDPAIKTKGLILITDNITGSKSIPLEKINWDTEKLLSQSYPIRF